MTHAASLSSRHEPLGDRVVVEGFANDGVGAAALLRRSGPQGQRKRRSVATRINVTNFD
jgi:hypothetical protein